MLEQMINQMNIDDRSHDIQIVGIDEIDPKVVLTELEELYYQLERGRSLGGQDQKAIIGLFHHIDKGHFHAVAKRLGGTWRRVSALCDRMIELEGYLALVIAGAEAEAVVAKEVPKLFIPVELELLALEQFANKYGLVTTREIIEQAKENLVQAGGRAHSGIALVTASLTRLKE